MNLGIFNKSKYDNYDYFSNFFIYENSLKLKVQTISDGEFDFCFICSSVEKLRFELIGAGQWF